MKVFYKNGGILDVSQLEKNPEKLGRKEFFSYFCSVK
jgi:hypothetical protein